MHKIYLFVAIMNRLNTGNDTCTGYRGHLKGFYNILVFYELLIIYIV